MAAAGVAREEHLNAPGKKKPDNVCPGKKKKYPPLLNPVRERP
jgi:hypothetical protein